MPSTGRLAAVADAVAACPPTREVRCAVVDSRPGEVMPRRLLVLTAFLLLATGACATGRPAVSPTSVPAALPQAVPPTAAGPEISLDTKGVDFSPWIRGFTEQVRRHWFVPRAALQRAGHVVVTFRVFRDGRIDGLAVKEASEVDEFNHYALRAIADVAKTAPLPAA